jgi:hypothetical protein
MDDCITQGQCQIHALSLKEHIAYSPGIIAGIAWRRCFR